MLFCSTAPQSSGRNKLGVNQLSQMPGASVDAAQEAMLWEPQEECQEKDVSVADIQDLSSIPCEQNFQRGVECRTPRPSHAPTSVSTPLGSDSSFCGSQETSSTLFKTFTTAWEGERSMEIPVVAPRICPFGPKEPVGLPPVASSLRNTRQAPALSEASPPSSDELPPPAQELLDEIGLTPVWMMFWKECSMQFLEMRRSKKSLRDTLLDDIKDQKSHPQQQLARAPPFRKIVLDESSLHD
nr:inactive serine/threonine-protein kinase TEX14-like isoform X3 [Zonotrichia albicollis]